MKQFTPHKYSNVYLTTLTASPLIVPKVSLERQQRIVQKVGEILTTNPMQGFAFFGPPGTGKTTLMAGICNELAARHVVNHCYFWTTMSEWLRQVTDFVSGRTGRPPRLDASNITRFPAHVFVDEFDQTTLSDFFRSRVEEFVNALYEHQNNTQLVIAMNSTRPMFEERFGTHIFRRIDEMCLPIDLFEKVPA